MRCVEEDTPPSCHPERRRNGAKRVSAVVEPVGRCIASGSTRGKDDILARDPARLCLALLRSSTSLTLAQDDTGDSIFRFAPWHICFANIAPTLQSFWLRRAAHFHLRCGEHIFNENSIPRCRIVYKNVGDGSNDLAVLNDGRAGQVCGQEGTTLFNEKFIKLF